MTEQELDFWHDQGKVPDWWYYQKSTKPLWMKWQEQTDNFYKEIEQRQREKEKNDQIEETVKQQIEAAVEAALNDLFTDFK